MAITSPETIFVDTSAVFAVLDGGDRFHRPAREAWSHWVEQETRLLTSNYVVLEATALIRNRLGIRAVGDLHRALLPMLQVEWVTRVIHEEGVNLLLTANQRRLSLVDCTSFEMMCRLELHNVFTFDQHFAEQGFICLP